MATAEYRACRTQNEQLRCLLFAFSIPDSVVMEEFNLTRHQIYYFKKKKGEVRPTAGRPSILEPFEVESIKKGIAERADMLKPPTRSDLIEMVQP